MEEIPQAYLNKSRSDKFRLHLNLPEFLKKSEKPLSERATKYLNLDSLVYSIHGNVVPQINIPSISIPFSGQVAKVSSLSRPEYDKISVNFVIDNKFNNYWVLYYWLNRINDAKKSIFNSTDIRNIKDRKDLHEYMARIKIEALDEYNNPIIEWTYHKCFPIALDGIQWSYQKPDELESSFSFDFSQMDCEII